MPVEDRLTGKYRALLVSLCPFAQGDLLRVVRIGAFPQDCAVQGTRGSETGLVLPMFDLIHCGR